MNGCVDKSTRCGYGNYEVLEGAVRLSDHHRVPLHDDRRRVALAFLAVLGGIAILGLAIVAARRSLGLAIGEVKDLLLVVVPTIAAVAGFYFRSR